MEPLEVGVIKMALEYLALSKDESIYSEYRLMYVDVACKALRVLIGEEEDGGQVDKTVN